MPVISPVYMRMKQAVTWLKQNKQMLQKDIAEKMGMSDVSFSRGMDRIQHKLDEDFIIKFHQATEEIFSLDWLMNGTMPKFTHEISVSYKTEQQPIDHSSLVNAALAAKDETIAALRDQLTAKDKVIQAKDELIASLRQQITILQQSVRIDEPFKNYPFEIGVEEDGKRQATQV